MHESLCVHVSYNRPVVLYDVVLYAFCYSVCMMGCVCVCEPLLIAMQVLEGDAQDSLQFCFQ